MRPVAMWRMSVSSSNIAGQKMYHSGTFVLFAKRGCPLLFLLPRGWVLVLVDGDANMQEQMQMLQGLSNNKKIIDEKNT